MKRIRIIAIVSVLCALAFWLGRFCLSRQVVVYSAEGYTEAFPRSEPVYGLDMALYAAVLSELRGTNPQKGLSDLEAELDDSVERAEHRRPLLSGWRRDQLDKALAWAARYREKYPRAIDTSTNGISPLALKWAETSISEEKQVDAFLHNCVVTNEKPNSAPESTATAPTVSTNK
jgi:hypothetical protein